MIRTSDLPGLQLLRWQAASVGSLSDFAWNEVNAIQWPPPATLATPGRRFLLRAGRRRRALRLAAGLDDGRAELDIPRLGRIHVERTQPPSDLPMARRRRPDLPRSRTAWSAGTSRPARRTGARTRASRRPTARARRSAATSGCPSGRASSSRSPGRPSRTSSSPWGWTTRTTRSSGPSGSRRGAATWSSSASSSRRRTWRSCRRFAPGPGRTHLQAYLDQAKGRILVFSPGGKQLADLKVAGNKPAALPGLYLANIRGDVRLEWLRIGRWNGEIPREARTDQARIHRADGSIALRPTDRLSSPTRRSSS